VDGGGREAGGVPASGSPQVAGCWSLYKKGVPDWLVGQADYTAQVLRKPEEPPQAQQVARRQVLPEEECKKVLPEEECKQVLPEEECRQAMPEGPGGRALLEAGKPGRVP